MEVSFPDLRLKKRCEDAAQRRRWLGDVAAIKLKTRLDELDAAQCMEDMRHMPGHWEELRGDRKGQFSCRLAGGLRLVVAPKRQPPPSKPEGGMDWRAIDQITVIEVVDYHD